jgi:1-acyl-sn-glycerol-3-phosphate acyltransferase
MFWTLTTVLGSYLYIIIMIIPVVILSIISTTGNLPHIMARYWARFTLLCSKSEVEVRGQENIPESPAIYMPNHVSHFDVFAILGYLNVQFRWIVKKELFSIPLLGLAMRRAGYILIDRGNHENAIRSMDLAAEKIRAGTSILIFPEGTRSSDGILQYPLKKGGFHLAIQAGVPIIPITVQGSREILPKNGIRVKPGKIIITIGKGIHPDSHNVNSLMEEVYKSIKLGYTS